MKHRYPFRARKVNNGNDCPNTRENFWIWWMFSMFGESGQKRASVEMATKGDDPCACQLSILPLCLTVAHSVGPKTFCALQKSHSLN